MLIDRYLINPFSSPRISATNLLAFSTDHLQRLIANNPGGRWDGRIAETTAALAQLQETWQDNDGLLGQRKARKQALRRYRQSLPARLAKITATIVVHYGAKSPEWKECCPGGLTQFSRSSNDRLATHLQALLHGITAHVGTLGPALVAETTALCTEWAALHDASETSSGRKAASEDARRQARQQLQVVLYLNLHHLALLHPDEPERLSLYMQESLLKKSKLKTEK